jgi:hypothetical protein
MSKKPTLKLVHGAGGHQPGRAVADDMSKGPQKLNESGQRLLDRMLDEGVIEGDSLAVLPSLPRESVDLFFTSPPYADARAYSRIHPDRYVDWFLPFARAMYDASKPSAGCARPPSQAPSPRNFLMGAQPDYLIGKLAPKQVYDPDETEKRFRARLLELRKNGTITKAQAREARAELEELAFGYIEEVQSWAIHSELSDHFDMMDLPAYGPDPEIRGFFREIWPRFKELLVRDLKEFPVFEAGHREIRC